MLSTASSAGPVAAIRFQPFNHPDVPAARRVEARNLVAFAERFRCPDCNGALKIEFGSISCPSCHQTGDPASWAGLIAKARRGVTIDPCAFCSAPTNGTEIGYRRCTRCGIEFDPQIKHRVDQMSVGARAQFIGYYHALNDHPYRWQYEPLDRSAEREYARGWLSAPIRTEKARANRRLWEREAAKDAELWGWPFSSV